MQLVRPIRAAATALALALVAALAVPTTGPGAPDATVIVRATADAVTGVVRAVAATGGAVTARLDALGMLVADVPEGAVDGLSSVPGVTDVRRDAPASLHVARGAEADRVDRTAVRTLGADLLHAEGVDGSGVGIAVIDTGVDEVAALSGRVLPGVDLSGRGNGRDEYGHGTPIAGLAAGGGGVGVAPGSHVVPVRIADADGHTDVARLLIGLDWTIRHADALDVGVVNISLGTVDGPVDLVRAAVEQAWDAGLVVVVAAGNGGAGTIGAPADSALVLGVGSTAGRGTRTIADDVLVDWSATGADVDGRAKPDVVVPGQSLAAPGAIGSWAWTNHPEGHLGDGLQRVSGTSFSTGLVSGAAALLRDAHPDWTPDEVLGALAASRRDVSGAVLGTPWLPTAVAGPAVADNVGATRAPLVELQALGPAPADLLADALDTDLLGALLAGSSWYGSSWYGAWSPTTTLLGTMLYGSSWYGSSWYGSSWYGSSWYGSSWYGSSWYGSSWYGSSWYGSSWY